MHSLPHYQHPPLEWYWDRLGPGTWDPLLQCLHLDKRLLEQQNTKKLYGTKNSCVHVHLGQIMDNKIQKDQKPNCHFWRVPSKNRVLCMHPAHNTTKRVGKPPKLLLLPNPRSRPYPHPISGISLPPASGSDQGHLLLVFTPSCCSRNPNKALPKFLFWPLINFYWLGKAKNLMGNSMFVTIDEPTLTHHHHPSP